jgi:hypothetical protein
MDASPYVSWNVLRNADIVLGLVAEIRNGMWDNNKEYGKRWLEKVTGSSKDQG